MLRKVYGVETVHDKEIEEWFKRFQDGQNLFESDTSVPKLSILSESIERVRIAIKQNRRITIQQLMDDLEISRNIIIEILIYNLNMIRVFKRFVPRILSQYMKDIRMEIAEDNLETVRKNPELLKKIITGNETWICGHEYISNTELPSSHWMPYQSKKPRFNSNIKVLLLVFFDYEGIVHYEFAPPYQMIDKEYYQKVLDRLYTAVRLKRSQLWSIGNWVIHHDVTVRTCNIIREFLTKHAIIELQQPPYSPDISPCDYWLFPRLNKALKGSQFNNVKELEENVTKQLMLIPKVEFEESLKNWEKRWEKVVDMKGNYFQSDCNSIDGED
ncbi:histone-lysine N-methyltransferase SETMAR-like [Vespa crabro]|uniref:histone-lysine N-methyltransferase SETMAR-like n=1 Tax=Vespa crabro TaxID=7445 RepID=UPI001F00B26A|nr:histone-lysine N-methyltransferase SETMAR-like [Vespa crabro]